jgi:hypothetical protein
MCSERGMALASFEQPSESHDVFDFLGGSGRLQRKLIIIKLWFRIFLISYSALWHSNNDIIKKR